MTLEVDEEDLDTLDDALAYLVGGHCCGADDGLTRLKCKSLRHQIRALMTEDARARAERVTCDAP